MSTEALLTSGWQHWTTPEHVLERVYKVGDVVLDPCSNDASLVRAAVKLDTAGLDMPWDGLAYVNPPYTAMARWTRKMREEAARGVEIVGLFPSRTDTAWMHNDIFGSANAAVFWKGRIQFGNPPPPKCNYCDTTEDAPCHLPGQLSFHEFDPKPTTNSPTIPSMVAYWGPRSDFNFLPAFGDAGEPWRKV